jgi:hypothetical protein
MLLFFFSTAACSAPLPQVRDGDIIFHTSRSSQSVAIQRATHSPYSHMGLILFRGGKPYVFEAVAKVRFTPLKDWIARGQGGHFMIKRLADSSSLLEPDGIAKLKDAAHPFEGRAYDLTFEWSVGRPDLLLRARLEKIYDRALGVHIGELQRLRDFDLNDPAVRTKMRERYGTHVPLEEPVISPAAMLQSSQLVTVAER